MLGGKRILILGLVLVMAILCAGFVDAGYCFSPLANICPDGYADEAECKYYGGEDAIYAENKADIPECKDVCCCSLITSRYYYTIRADCELYEQNDQAGPWVETTEGEACDAYCNGVPPCEPLCGEVHDQCVGKGGLVTETGNYYCGDNHNLYSDQFSCFDNCYEEGCVVPQDGMEIDSDTIFCPGTYHLNNGLNITNSDIVLDCFSATLIGNQSSPGIIINGTSHSNPDIGNIVVRNCNIINYTNGIDVYSSSGNSFINNKVSSCTNNGFYLYYLANDNILEDNMARDNGDSGYYISFNSKNNKLINNKAINNVDGIHVQHYSNSLEIINNTLINNSGSGIYSRLSRTIYLGDNVAEGNFVGFWTGSSISHTIENNLAKDNNRGFDLNCDGCSVIQNTAEDNLNFGFATLNQGGGSTTFKANIAKNNKDGFIIGLGSYSISNNYIDNIVVDNSDYGFNLRMSYEDTFSGNLVKNNQIGFLLSSPAYGLTLEYNDIYSNIEYNLQNNGDNVVAENNWWGYDDYNLIAATIFGNVDFDPWLSLDPESRISDLIMGDISFDDVEGMVNVSSIINNTGSYDVVDLDVKFLDTYSGNLIQESTINVGALAAGQSKTVNIILDLEEGHIIHAIVDPDNKINELDKTNNNIQKEYLGILKYYVEADVPLVSNVIETYVKTRINDGIIVESIVDSDVNIFIASHNSLMIKHDETLDEKGWGFYGGTIKFQDKVCSKPYCGIIGNLVVDGKQEIYIGANDISGFITASNVFINNQDSFKTEGGSVIYLGEDDEDAIAVYDYLHTDDNLVYYKTDSTEFREIVRKALNGEKYIELDGNLTTTISDSEINLRYKRLASEHNQVFLEYRNSDDYPIVMAGGLWSDIDVWAELGTELSDEGKDIWLIEITGGPDMECDDCPDYTYEDLTDNVWPTYIDGIKSLSGKDKVNYIGHSNGARVGLSSLNDFYGVNSPISKFISVACPATLNDETSYTNLIREMIENQFVNDFNGNYAMSKIEMGGKTHVRQATYLNGLVEYGSDLLSSLFAIKVALFDDGKISKNLLDFYNQLSIDDNSLIDLSEVDLDRLYVFNTDPHDTIVGIEDQDMILDGTTGIDSGDKEGIIYGDKWRVIYYNHAALKKREIVKEDIKGVLE